MDHITNVRLLCGTAFFCSRGRHAVADGDMSTDVRNESLAEEFSTLSSSELRYI